MRSFHWIFLVVSSLVVNGFAAPVRTPSGVSLKIQPNYRPSTFHDDTPSISPLSDTSSPLSSPVLISPLSPDARSGTQAWTNAPVQPNRPSAFHDDIVRPPGSPVSGPLVPTSPLIRTPSPHAISGTQVPPPIPPPPKNSVPNRYYNNRGKKAPKATVDTKTPPPKTPPPKDGNHQSFSALPELKTLNARIGDLIGESGESKLYHVFGFHKGDLRLKVFPTEKVKEFNAEITSAETRGDYVDSGMVERRNVNTGKVESRYPAVLIRLHGVEAKSVARKD